MMIILLSLMQNQRGVLEMTALVVAVSLQVQPLVELYQIQDNFATDVCVDSASVERRSFAIGFAQRCRLDPPPI